MPKLLYFFMAKRKHKSKKQKHDLLYYTNIAILVITSVLIIFLIYKIAFKQPNSHKIQHNSHKSYQTKNNEKTIHEKFEEKTKALEIEYVDEDPIEQLPQITKPKPQFLFDETNDEIIHDIIQPKQIIEKTPKYTTTKTKKTIIKDTRPMLAILIDDVTLQKQINKIQNIGYPITMSFLPPTKIHKHSADIAKPFDIYMIHLPLEAKTRRFEETNTLHIGDSLSKIDARIKYLKHIYPKAKYINNHTGSRFTANRDSMDKLLRVLKKYHFVFVDSRTTAKTKTKEFARKYQLRYISRNVFLDNKQNRQYIRNQLKKAVKIAKQNGSAIAIGHPHNITLQTLKDSKDLLKNIHLVYINKL